MKNNFKKLVGALVLSVVVIASLVGCGTKASSEAASTDTSQEGTDPITGETYPEEIRLGILNGSLADTVANLEGYYDEFEEKTGVKTSIYYFESGRDVNNAYASDSIDFGSFGSSPISLGTTNGLGYEVIFLNALIGDVEALAVSNDIETASDLSGKTIATPFASTSHYSLLNYLKVNNLDDVNVIDLEPQDILAAWERGDIDGAYVWSPVLAEIKKDGHFLVTSAELAEEGIITADLSTVNKEFAEKYPTLVAEYIDIHNKIYELIESNQDQVIADAVEGLQLSEDEAKEQLTGEIWLSLSDQLNEKYLGPVGGESGLAETIKNTAEFHVSQGNLDHALDLEEYKSDVDSSFVEILLNR